MCIFLNGLLSQQGRVTASRLDPDSSTYQDRLILSLNLDLNLNLISPLIDSHLLASLPEPKEQPLLSILTCPCHLPPSTPKLEPPPHPCAHISSFNKRHTQDTHIMQ